jgi:Helix-turn-helix domain
MKNNSSIQGARLSSPHDSRGALKLNEARQYLGGLSVPTMHRLIQRGLLKPNRSLRHLLFPVVELDRFLKDGMT